MRVFLLLLVSGSVAAPGADKTRQELEWESEAWDFVVGPCLEVAEMRLGQKYPHMSRNEITGVRLTQGPDPLKLVDAVTAAIRQHQSPLSKDERLAVYNWALGECVRATLESLKDG